MKTRPYFLLGVVTSAALLFSPPAHAAAFPAAQGFGAVATGGTTVVHVTSLADTGPGSLRAALAESGRKIVFDLAGTITIASALSIPSDTTVDGTTAPSPGITVTGHSTSMSGKNNIILRNLRFRETLSGPAGKCSLQAADAAYNILIDHCSIEQGRWDCLGLTDGTHDVTVQYSIIGNAIAPQRFGAIIDAVDRITLHHNLFINNQSRNPKLKANAQYINNLIYNWGVAGLVGGHSSAPWKSDVINNVFIAGPNSAGGNWLSQCKASDNFYIAGNQHDLDKNGVWNPTEIADAGFLAEGVTLHPQKFHQPADAVTIDTPAQCLKLATAGSFGCQPLDAMDQGLIDQLKSFGTKGEIAPPPAPKAPPAPKTTPAPTASQPAP